MEAAIIATGHEVVAKRLLFLVKRLMKTYNITRSEANELAMRSPAIWKGYEHLI